MERDKQGETDIIGTGINEGFGGSYLIGSRGKIFVGAETDPINVSRFLTYVVSLLQGCGSAGSVHVDWKTVRD